MRPTAAALGATLALATTTLVTTTLVTTTLGTSPVAARQAGTTATQGRAARAHDRLAAEATGPLRVTRGPDGRARVVGVAGGEARNPAVTRTMSARAAARAHLHRYGALVGVADRRTRLVNARVSRVVGGDRVVRFREVRRGLPVIGGAVAVDLRPDGQLGSLTASVSRARVPGPATGRAAARRDALAAARRHAEPGAALRAGPAVRRLYDPAVQGVARTADPATHARGVWRVVVRGGAAFRRTVLVDDRSGAVVLDVDAVEAVDRVVCDNQNFQDQLALPCTHDFARTESGPPSDVSDVNDAFDLAGVVSDFYAGLGGIDLTDLLGVPFGGAKHLSSTVRFCDPFRPDCPMANAFWNGAGMFYGEGYAAADDVVAHELTHGVIQHSSNLLYWGPSGAIDESLADTMGEILDHRHPGPGDAADSWTIGEDLPGAAVRDVRDPAAYGQPASTTDPEYVGGVDDNGGVHTDSGVGNRTFYLISQGGTEHGHTVTGIDDASLDQTAALYLSVMQHLVSGSDWADLAGVLEQSCTDLATAGTAGLTGADCAQVHTATVGTRLRIPPPAAPQRPDAPMTCPAGAGPVRVLFDSEQGGDPASLMHAGPTWSRAPSDVAPENAVSGHDSWFSLDPDDIGRSSLRWAAPVALPEGQPTYLWFRQWRVLDYLGDATFDAGTVEVDDTTARGGPRPAEGPGWVNGPRDVIDDRYGNPAGGRRGFGKDSFGWTASRLDLTPYAGHALRPRFSMNSDEVIGYPGWYLDDVRVYTCGGDLEPTAAPAISGDARVGSTLAATLGGWSLPDPVLGYQWYADGRARAGATGAAYQVRAGDLGRRITVRVTATVDGHGSSATTSPATVRVQPR
ncbi:MAG TPA: M4 family metallopeptidase [Nocardioides sp.]|nr:M4 family metallopeptidase [Nocardioides sp.]